MEIKKILTNNNSPMAKTLLPVLCFLFLAGGMNTAFSQRLKNVEYFFDADPGVGLGRPLLIGSGSTLDQNFSISTAGLSSGRHVLFIRTQDTANQWSIAESRSFTINAQSQSPVTSLGNAEYFFDTDPGAGLGRPLPIGSGATVDQNFSMSTAGLTAGRHVLYIRLRDSDGRWSISESRTFQVVGSETVIQDSLIAAEYYLDTDPGPGNGIAIPFRSGVSVDTLFRYVANNLPLGLHQICIRFGSRSGRWSVAECRQFTACESYGPVAGFEIVRDNNKVSFLNRSLYGTTFNWRINSGDSVVGENYFNTFSAGNYRVLLTAVNSCGRDTLSKAFAIEGLKGVSPAYIGDNGITTLRIDGFGFTAGTTVRISKGATVLNLSAVYPVSGDILQTSVNARNLENGFYRLEVNIPGRPPLVLENALQVGAVMPPLVNVSLQLPPRIRRLRTTMISVLATNRGNIDAYAVPVMVSGFPVSVIVKLLNDTSSISSISIPNVPGISNDKFMLVDSVEQIRMFPLLIPRISPGETVTIKFSLFGLEQTTDFNVFASSFEPLLGNDTSTSTGSAGRPYASRSLAEGGCTYVPPGAPPSTTPPTPPGNPNGCNPCINENTADLLFQILEELTDIITDLIPAKRWVNCAKSTASFAIGVIQKKVAEEDCPSQRPTLSQDVKKLASWSDFVASGVKATYDCVTALIGSIPPVAIAKTVFRLLKTYKRIQTTKKLITFKNAAGCIAEGCKEPPCPGCSSNKTTVILTSYDPNDKTGPGDRDSGYIKTSDALVYTISYENKPTATLPAQSVFIYDTLDLSQYDIGSIEFLTASVGRKSVSLLSNKESAIQTIDLRPDLPYLARINARVDTASGSVQWQIQTIDTLTLQEPEDPLAGFLPPNDSVNRGEGTVSFSVRLRNTVQQGSIIKNRAHIVFDNNEPIITRYWVNQFDTVPPVSRVSPLPDSVFADRIVVNWSGTDNASGIERYNIWVSINGGQMQPWVSCASGTVSDTLEGVYDDVYAIYSQAVDEAGNVEQRKTVPEAVIKFKLAPTVFTFNGNGDYRDSANWVGNLLPPIVLPAGSEIIINPSGNGECLMNKVQEVKPGGKFTVVAGKKIKLIGPIDVR